MASLGMMTMIKKEAIMRKYLFFAGILLVAAISCQKEQVDNDSTAEYTITISASGDITKATLDDSDNMIWETGDQIGVRLYKGSEYYGTDSGSGYLSQDVAFTLTDGAGTTNGSFSMSTTDPYLHWGYSAFYPKYDSNHSNGKLYIHLQSYYTGYVSDRLLLPMVAHSTEDRPSKVTFKHVAAGIKVKLIDIPGSASQVSLSMPGHNIQGWYNIDPATAGSDNGILIPNDATYAEDRSTVYLQFAAADDKRDMTFIFPVPTMEFSENDKIVLKLYTGANSSYTEFWNISSKLNSATLAGLGRGEVLVMPDITVPITPEEKDDKIWIDGNTKDWSEINTKFTTTDDRIKEWKYTSDSNNLYLQYKIDASKIVPSSGDNYDYNPFIYIGFDTDNDPDLGSNADGGLGNGYDARAVIFPWRGPKTGSPQCVIGVDNNGHIDILGTSTTVQPKIGGKIKDGYCYVEVRIPFSSIGITSSTSYITVNHSMAWTPIGRQMIPIAGGPLPAIITASNQTVGVGQNVSIGATTNSTGTITYVSNDETIATVDDDGVITGVAEGSTTITLSVASVGSDYTSGTKTINVTVTPTYTPAITIDGDMAEWSDIATARTYGNDSYLHYWKFKSDSRKIYFYLALRKNRVDVKKSLYIGFNIDNDSDTGSNYGNVPGCEAYAHAIPFTNEEGATPIIGVNGLDANSYVTDSVLGTHNGGITIASYDASESYDSDSSNIYVELSINKSQLSLPATGNIKVGCSYGWRPSSPIEAASVTLE